MQKAGLINLFGGVRKTATALDMSRAGFHKWPDGEISGANLDRAIGACIRIKGESITKAHFPGAFEAYKAGQSDE